jgi:hypothetical protein
MKPTKCDKNIIDNNFKWKDIEKLNTMNSNNFDVGVTFKNGHWASIIINEAYNIYGYEILSSITQKNGGYVKTYQTKKQIMNHLKYISKLTK